MNRTERRLRCLADAEAAANRTGLVRCQGGYSDSRANGERHRTVTAHELVWAGYLKRWGTCLHITDAGRRTLEIWREEAAGR